MHSFYVFSPNGLPLNVVLPALVGNIAWITAYTILIFRAQKNQFIEIPILIITGNLVWEALYGFVLPASPVLNPIIHYEIKVWCILDCAILFFAIKYAKNSISTPLILKYIKPISFLLIVFWTGIIYAIAESGISENAIYPNQDLVREAASAYILNVIISVMYIFQYLQLYNQHKFLPSVAWLKMVGTGLTTFSVYINKPFNLLLFVMGIIVLVADILYIVLLKVLPNVLISPPKMSTVIPTRTFRNYNAKKYLSKSQWE